MNDSSPGNQITVDPRDIVDEVLNQTGDTYGDPKRHEVEQIGTRLRDAAVDPAPGDFLPPPNAGVPGQAGNPHGASVVAIEVDDPRRTAAITELRASQAGGSA